MTAGKLFLFDFVINKLNIQEVQENIEQRKQSVNRLPQDLSE